MGLLQSELRGVLALLLRDQYSPVLSALQSHQQPVRGDALLHQLNTNISLILVGKRFYWTKPPFSTECPSAFGVLIQNRAVPK